MLLSALFSLSADLCLVDVRLEDEGVTLVLRSSQTSAVCPACMQPSTRVHGHYTRRLDDLPCQKRAVHICLEVRRFRCATRRCPRTTFAERFPLLTHSSARRTLRQAEALTEIAFAQGGKAGAKLAKRLAMPASRDTLLRLIRSSPLPKRKTPRVLGLDDFAWKKGDRYGTLLVDLEAHCPVEMLPDREAVSVTRWLRSHPGVKIISRDRAGAYAEGARRGAPRARQVADRFHLLVNLREAIQDALARHQNALPMLEGERAVPPTASEHPTREPGRDLFTQYGATDEQTGAASPPGAASPLTAAEQRRHLSRAHRYARYERVIALHREGLSQRAIARQLHVSRQVVRRFVTASTFPERARSSRRQSKLDAYLPYLRSRWEQGCHNALQLAREMQAQGFAGSTSLVSQLLGEWRASLPVRPVRGKKRQAAPPARRRVSPRQASWLFVKKPEQLTPEQRAFTQQICQTHPDLQELYQLGQAFVHMIQHRQRKRLDAWLLHAQKKPSLGLQGFAAGLKRDYSAVQAALVFPWSQGQVEGHITRLKLLKRQMYGRARFDLLRLRVLSPG